MYATCLVGPLVASVRTSVGPIRGYQVGTQAAFSASERYNGSETHAAG